MDDAQVRIEEALLFRPGGVREALTSLALPIGTLAADQTAYGWWELAASPAGTVTEFAATAQHDEALGGLRTSLLDISDENAWVVRCGLVNDAPGGTNSTAVLLDRDRDLQADSLLDLSDSREYAVALVGSTITQQATIPDPFVGRRDILEVRESDGRLLDPRNYWLQDNMIHMVDHARTGYSIVFDEPRTTTAKLSLNRVAYAGYVDDAIVVLEDEDANKTLGPNNDSVFVRIVSDAEPAGELLELPETEVAGRFRGTMKFDPTTQSEDGRIHVGNDNSVAARSLFMTPSRATGTRTFATSLNHSTIQTDKRCCCSIGLEFPTTTRAGRPKRGPMPCPPGVRRSPMAGELLPLGRPSTEPHDVEHGLFNERTVWSDAAERLENVLDDLAVRSLVSLGAGPVPLGAGLRPRRNG